MIRTIALLIAIPMAKKGKILIFCGVETELDCYL